MAALDIGAFKPCKPTTLDALYFAAPVDWGLTYPYLAPPARHLVFPFLVMSHVCYAAAVSVVNPDDSLSDPSIYMIQIPSPDGSMLSEDAAVAQIKGNLWIAVGDRIVAAAVAPGPSYPGNTSILRPLRDEDWFYTQYAPILLRSNLFDPHHPDYAEFRKCVSPEMERVIWKFADHARERRDGYLLWQDGHMTPYSHIYDHMAPMRGSSTQARILGHGTSGVQDGSDGYDVHFNDAMGVNPMDTIGPLPSYEPVGNSSDNSESDDSESEQEPQIEQKPAKSATRGRSAGKVKREALGGATVKIPPSRRGRLPWPKKAATTTIAKRARRALLRKPVSRRVSTPKKTTAARLAANSTSTPTPSPKKPRVATPSPKKPFPGVVSSTAFTPAPSQTSPTRLTRSTTRQGLMTLPSTPPLPARRITAPRSTRAPPAAPVGPQAIGASQGVAGSRRIPASAPPSSQPVAGPSSARMEDVPKTAEAASLSGYMLRPRDPLRRHGRGH